MVARKEEWVGADRTAKRGERREKTKADDSECDRMSAGGGAGASGGEREVRLWGTHTAPSLQICTLCYEINHGTGVIHLRCLNDLVVKSRVVDFGRIRNWNVAP